MYVSIYIYIDTYVYIYTYVYTYIVANVPIHQLYARATTQKTVQAVHLDCTCDMYVYLYMRICTLHILQTILEIGHVGLQTAE